MSFEKIVTQRLSRVVTQGTDTLLVIGGVSAGNSATSVPNLFAGQRLWENAAIVGMVDTVTSSGLFNVTVHGRVCGQSFPIARKTLTVVGITVIPTTTGTGAVPTPTSVEWDYVSGTDQTSNVVMMAKGNRGVLRGQNSGTQSADKVVEAQIAKVGTSLGVNSGVSAYQVPTNWILQGNSADFKLTLLAGTSTISHYDSWARFGGLDQMKFWDVANYYWEGTGCSGSWTINVQGFINDHLTNSTSAGPDTSARGNTQYVTIASCLVTGADITGITGAAGVTRIALTSQFAGPSPVPRRIFFDVTTAGVSQQIGGNLYVIAKASRGQLNKT